MSNQMLTPMENQDEPNVELLSLFESELKASDNRYLKLRSQLLETLTSNAQLLEYVHYLEDKLTFYKQKAEFNHKKHEIESNNNPSRLSSPSLSPSTRASVIDINDDDEIVIDPEPQPNGSFAKPKIFRHRSVSVITSFEQFDKVLHKNSSKVNQEIYNNLTMYQSLAESLGQSRLSIDKFIHSICQILSFEAASIYSISHSLESITCELSTLQHLDKKYSQKINDGVLSQIVRHKRTIIIRDITATNFPFNPEIDDRFYNEHLQNPEFEPRSTFTVCLEPLFNENKEMIGILELISSQNKNEDYANSVFRNILKSSRNLVQELLNKLLIERDNKNSNIHKEALFELAKVMSNTSEDTTNDNSIENLIEKIRKTVYKSINCDKVAIFMVDEISQELWCSASDDVAGIRIPLSKGIVGHTVTTGESLNIKDAYQDSRFNPAVDKKTNYKTTTILCVPIKYNNKIIGAMECINKHNNEYFTETDVELLNEMAEETAPTLQNKFMESALRIIQQGLQDSTSRDYLSQFMHNENNQILQSRSKRNSKGKRVLSLGRNNSNNLNGTSKLYARISNSIRAQDICTWNFNYFRLMEDNYQTAIPMMVYMFNDFGLLDRFNIPERKLYSFLIAVKQHYYDNPYHNFLHAFSVLHVCYVILKKTSMMNHFTILDVLSIFIASVCHDLEHPGLTNAYQVNSGSELAMRYNDKSVLENHHAHIGSLLLRKPEMNILNELTPEEINGVRKSMISIILHTDMSYHQDIVTGLSRFSSICTQNGETPKNNQKDSDDNLLQVPNGNGTDSGSSNSANLSTASYSSSGELIYNADRQFLSETLVHLGDLSNAVMRWDQSHEWSLRVIDEFVAQCNLEKEQGLKISMTFITDKSPEAISKVQTSFIDYVVKPLWKTVSNIAPELNERISVLNGNRENWGRYPSEYQELRAIANENMSK